MKNNKMEDMPQVCLDCAVPQTLGVSCAKKGGSDCGLATPKAAHTPGLWKVDGTVVEAKWENGESVMVCQTGGTRWGGCSNATEYNNRMRKENIANAALISAAPDLLAALKALCAWHDHEALTGLPYGKPVAAWAPSFDDTVKMVHAAIAKARGAK
jgi:hypothetical protein